MWLRLAGYGLVRGLFDLEPFTFARSLARAARPAGHGPTASRRQPPHRVATPMTADAAPPPQPLTVTNRAGSLQAVLQAHGALHTLRSGNLVLNLFPSTAPEAGPANLWLRLRLADGRVRLTPLLGPVAPGGQQRRGGPAGRQGIWRQVAWALHLVLAADRTAWFWHLALHNRGHQPLALDVVMLQDLALAPWPTLRLNEAYVSQYLDHQPLAHPHAGWVVATRQNQPVDGRVPWVLCGSLGRACGFATDGLQLQGLGRRGVGGGAASEAGAGGAVGVDGGDGTGAFRAPSALLHRDLPSSRLQHEHALVALQDRPLVLPPGAVAQRGFFGLLLDDHPAASGPADLAWVDSVRALPEARPPAGLGKTLVQGANPRHSPSQALGQGRSRGRRHAAVPDGRPASRSAAPQAAAKAQARERNLLASAPAWPSRHPADADLQAWVGDNWRHVERDAQGRALSFFCGGMAPGHVVCLAHEQRVLRPHGHLLRSGATWTPDETVLASTCWMAGVFHSSMTQGHASANRCLSTQRGWLGLYRGLGQRVLVDAGSGWRLLDEPSAWHVQPQQARWLYLADDMAIEVTAAADIDAPAMTLELRVLHGPALRVLVSHHVPLNARDGADDGFGAAQPDGPVQWQWLDGAAGHAVAISPAPGSDMARRFGHGGLQLHWQPDGLPVQVLGDEALFADGQSRSQPWLCLRADGVRQWQLRLVCTLVPEASPGLPGPPQPACPRFTLPHPDDHGRAISELGDWLPWLAHNALVHYLVPRGLEQFSGGGWGTRDVCQGPAELLLALGRFDALRDLLCRVFSAQNPDGDWPQWFMFYARDANIRAADSHGDIVYWPLVALADYLQATADASLLNEPLPFHGGQTAPVLEHVQRALAVARRRSIAGTRLAAYGHGDWNDALQPADPAMRDHLCSAWTVTLHHRMLRSLAAAHVRLGQPQAAQPLQDEAAAVLADFQRLLIADDQVTGYASFDGQGQVNDWLLHPRDTRTGLRHSALPMVHAIIDELFTPEQAAHHVVLIQQHLMGPDGLRLFDRPLAYRGGTMALFQRAESASYFGREIGLMYMHAHLRWAEALAQLGHADALLHALRLANPVGLAALLPQAAPRQRNCYHSSSDAAFADRAEASARYDRIHAGQVALEGGWRIYSSGAGIAWRLVIQRLLGLTVQADRLVLDPVLPATLDGLVVDLPLYGQPVQVTYRVGPRGHGLAAATLDGQPLALTPGHNRYRAPGAWVDARPLQAALADGATARHLVLTIG